MARLPFVSALRHHAARSFLSGGAAPDPHPLYPAFDRATARMRLSAIQTAGFAAGKLADATVDWDSVLLATSPTQPTITTTVTASTAAAIESAARAGGRRIEVDTDIAGAVDLNGATDFEIVADSPGRRVGAFYFDAFTSNRTTTGDFSSGTNTILNVADTTRMAVGETVSGDHVPDGTTVTDIDGTTVTMSADATGTETTASFSVYEVCRRGRIIGFETSHIGSIFGWGSSTDPATQDITVIGCVVNGQVLSGETVAVNPKNCHRMAFINSVLRGGDSTDTDGACFLFQSCKDIFVAGCNGLGGPAAADPNADDWFARSAGTGGYERINYVDCWAKSRLRNVIRIGGGGVGVLAYETADGAFSIINHGIAYGMKDIDLDSVDTQRVYLVGGTTYADDTITPGTVFMGPDATDGTPYSQHWVCDEHTARGPSDVVPTSLFTTMQSEEEPPDQTVWMGASNSVVQEAASEPTPPTISDPTLETEGWTGGEPNASVGYTSDPADLADT